MTIEERVLKIRDLFREAEIKRKAAQEFKSKGRALELECERMFGEGNKLMADLFEPEHLPTEETK